MVSFPGRTHFDVTEEQLDTVEREAREALDTLLDEWRPLIAADERLSTLAEAINDVQTRLQYVAMAREQLKAEASADAPDPAHE